MSLPTVTVAGTIEAPDGTNLDGKTVAFRTTAEMVDAAGNVLVPILTVRGKVVAGALKAWDGTSALVLFASNTGTTTVPYEITESWSTRKFTVNLLTTDQTGSPLHIPYASLGPVSPAPTATSPYVQSVVAGTNVTVDSTDPRNPVVSATGGGSGGTETVAGVSPVSGDVPVAPLVTALETGGLASQTSVASKADASALATETAARQAADTAEATTRAAADTTNANAIAAETTRAEGVEAGKADRSGPGSTVPRNQLPNISGSFWQQVANQAAMLALTAPDPDTALVVFRTDTPGTVWFLNPGLNAATLGNWGSYQDDAAGAAAAAQSAAIAAAATDATTKANAAQAASQPLDSDLTGLADPTSSAGTLVSDGSTWLRKTAAQFKTWLGLVAADIPNIAESQVTNLTTDLAAKAPLAGPFAPSSTGATAATRYVGGTASGPPTTGTFAVGDYVVTQDGKIYCCVSAGTPGTWRRQGAGFILASGYYTSSTDPTAITVDGAFHDIDAALTMTIPANVPFSCDISGLFHYTQGTIAAGTNAQMQARIVDSATATTAYTRFIDTRQFASAASSGRVLSLTVLCSRENAALGSDTAVKLQALGSPSGALSSCGFLTNAGADPIQIRAVAR